MAGTGTPGYSGDGGPATAAELDQPISAVPTEDGGFLISELDNCIVRMGDAGGTITTVAGVSARRRADVPPRRGRRGGQATATELYSPTSAESIAFKLAATGAGGASQATAKISRLKAKR